MKYYENCKELAEEAGFFYETLAKTMAEYNAIAAKMLAGEPGAPYEAYGGGMSWDPWGKKFFHNVPVEPTDEFHVAIVTPVIHYCMGGLEIDADSRVVKKVGANMVSMLRVRLLEASTATTALAGTPCWTASCLVAL